MAAATINAVCEFCSSVATVGSRCVDCVSVVVCPQCGDLEDADKMRDGACRSCWCECVDCDHPRHLCVCSNETGFYHLDSEDHEPRGEDVDDISW